MSLDLTTELNRYKKSELRRIVWQLQFLDKVDTALDKVLNPVIDHVYTEALSDLNVKTSRTTDLFFFRNLVKSAINKSADPSIQTAVSDSVNRNTGDSVGKTIGSQEDADIISTIDNRAVLPTDSTLSNVPTGGFTEAGISSTDLFDNSKKMQQKVLNSAAAVLSSAPESIPQLVMISLQKFIETCNDLISKFTELNATIEEIETDCAALDEYYFTGDRNFKRSENALPYLEESDTDLLSVRLSLINEGVFNEALYNSTKQKIKDAQDALSNYGGDTNKVIEIKGGITSLDFMMSALEESYDVFYQQLQNLIDCYDKCKTQSSSSLKGPMLSTLNQIQAEIRSVIRSINAAVEKDEIASAPTLERAWYMQLLALYQKMFLVPQNISEYIDSDPDGYIAYYIPVSDALNYIDPEENLDLLKHQIEKFKYWVEKRLEDDWPNNPNIQVNINNSSSQIQNDNISRMAKINDASIAASTYYVPVGDTPSNLSDVLLSAGLDRANDVMTRSDWESFFALTPDNSSFRGQFSLALTQELDAAINNPDLTVNALNDLSAARQYVINQKRADDLLSSTFARYKTLAQDMLVKEDMSEIQQVTANVERYQAEASQ